MNQSSSNMTLPQTQPNQQEPMMQQQPQPGMMCPQHMMMQQPQYGMQQQYGQQPMMYQPQQYGMMMQQQPNQQFQPQYGMQQPQYGMQQQYGQQPMMMQQQPQQGMVQQPIQQQPQQGMVQQTSCTTTTTTVGTDQINLVPQQQPMMMMPQQPIQTNIVQQQTTTTTIVPPPVSQDIAQSMRLVAVEEAAKEWLKKRLELIGWLEDMIGVLDKKQKKSTKAKVGGTATNIVGAGLIVGGIVAAPFTLGGSLLATGAGLGCVGAGTTTTVVASFMEWKHAKKSAKVIQELLQKDTQSVNDIVKKIYEYRLTDPNIEIRTISLGTSNVNVVSFVTSLVNFKHEGLNTANGLTNGNAGVVSLASLMIKGAVPIISIPVDMVLLVEESKKLHKKEPSKLAGKIAPILEGIKLQTQMATGTIVP